MGKSKLSRAIDLTTKIIIVPILLVSIFCSIMTFIAKRNSSMPHFFSYSVNTITSETMFNEGFSETVDIERINQRAGNYSQFASGKKVLLKRVASANLSVGNVIAFYDYMQDDNTELQYTQLENGIQVSSENADLSLKPFKGEGVIDASDSSYVVFHRIIKTYTAKIEGKTYIFFETKGDALDKSDKNLVREDYVIGRYEENGSNFFIGFLTFFSSSVGLIVLVYIPCVILLALLVFNLIIQFKEMKRNTEEIKGQTFAATQMLGGKVGNYKKTDDPVIANLEPRTVVTPVKSKKVPEAPAVKEAVSPVHKLPARPNPLPKRPPQRPAKPK